MNNLKVSPKFKLLIFVNLLIILLFCFTSTTQAQFYPFASPFPIYSPYNSFPLPLRFSPFQSYTGFFRPPALFPVPIFPQPLMRRAATTITIFSTTTLLVYNPSLLLGTGAAPVTPSPLLSLIAGQLLAFGHSALSTVNPGLFNYLVNTYLLPTGLALYVI